MSFEIEPGRLIIIEDEHGGFLHPKQSSVDTFLTKRLPKGSSMIVLHDYGSVKLPDFGYYTRRLKVLTALGTGWVYIGNDSKLN